MFEPLLPGYDMTVFHQWATRIAGGALSDGRAFYQAPLYPYVLGALYALAGPSALAAKLFQAVLGSLTVLLTYSLGSRLFSRRAGIIAALLTALTPIFPFYEIFLLRATLVTFLNLAFLLALFKFDRQKPMRGAIIAGVLLGIGTLARSNLLALWPVAAAWVWLVGGKGKSGLKALAVMTLAAGLAISPATLHNRIEGETWALVSTNFSENWKIGNSLDSEGGFGYPEKELAPVFSLTFLKLQANKAKFLLRDYEQPNNTNFYQMQPDNPWLGLGNFLSWNLYLAFGLAGIILTRGRWRQLFPLYGYLLFYGGTLVLFFVTSRFRVPLWPALILFSAAGIDRTSSMWKAGKRLEPALAKVLATILAAAMLLSNPRTIQPQYWDNLALIHERRGQWEEASGVMRSKERLHPDDPETLWKLAYYLQQEGGLERASQVLERLLKISGGHPEVLKEAGLLDLKLGRTERGVARLQGYLKATPGAADSSTIVELIAEQNTDKNQ